MLAHKYKRDKITYPCHVQPKLNGVRGIYVPGRHFQSRYGEIWNPAVVSHVFMPLTGLQFYLDGEFYCHGMSLQNINSRIGVVRNKPHAESAQIEFHVFDVIVDAPFHRRLKVLEALRKRFDDVTSVHVVQTEEVFSDYEADHWYRLWKGQEYEGMMYRDSSAHYGFAARCGNKENRWNCLLKRKETQDLDAVVVGFNQEHDQYGKALDSLGSFQLRAPNGAVFSAGSGLRREQRIIYWKQQEFMLGVNVKIKYEMLSDGGVPLKPIIECVEYEA